MKLSADGAQPRATVSAHVSAVSALSALAWVALSCDRSAPQLLHDMLAVLKTSTLGFGAIVVDELGG
jgi:hypothetical protein